MGDSPDSPDLAALHRARVRALPVEEVSRWLAKKAFHLGVPASAIEDLVQAAFLALVKKGAEKWEPAKDPKAQVFLVRAMEDALSAQRKKRQRQRTDLDTEAVEEAPPSSDPGPARAAMDNEEATWARARLLEGLAGSPLATQIVRLCMAEGELKPATLAERLGVQVRQVYTAQERIAEEMAKISVLARRRDATLKGRT